MKRILLLSALCTSLNLAAQPFEVTVKGGVSPFILSQGDFHTEYGTSPFGAVTGSYTGKHWFTGLGLDFSNVYTQPFMKQYPYQQQFDVTGLRASRPAINLSLHLGYRITLGKSIAQAGVQLGSMWHPQRLTYTYADGRREAETLRNLAVPFSIGLILGYGYQVHDKITIMLEANPRISLLSYGRDGGYSGFDAYQFPLSVGVKLNL
jgi:hypothetical protein